MEASGHSGSKAQRRANALGASSSPYLLQHAFNPVDWRPWGEDAFAEARRRDVPIFLSIGYSTCYWCHVMERESFENDSIAALMNERFVCIKVDREERPDVDDVYMTATQILTGHGGWPMSVFLEPHALRPFWCGTYFPPESRPGLGVPSFPSVLTNIGEAWKSRREEVLRQAEQIAAIATERLRPARRTQPINILSAATESVSGLLRMLDRNHGGFGGAPKFPQPVYLELLLDARENAGSPETTAAIDEAVRVTLDRMMIGGLFDHLAGGFHRYCVDVHWTVPHFEKMLYDNALLAGLYARASRVFSDPEYARVARRTCDYVLRELSVGGGFASAQDAEVNAHEGLNYIWTPEEIRSSLGPRDADFAVRVFGLDKGPNFRDPHHPDRAPAGVLRLSDRPEAVASLMGLAPEEFREQLDRVCAELLAVRAERPQPARDDKVLAGWNGLMIRALASCGRALGDDRLIRAGADAAAFVLAHHRIPGEALARSWRAGVRSGPGFLDDYAPMILGLLELAHADPSPGHLASARSLADEAHALFSDPSGVYFDVAPSQKDLLVRTRSTHDGAIPCASSMMLHALLELYRQTASEEYVARASGLLSGLLAPIEELPLGIANAVRAGLLAVTDPMLRKTGVSSLLLGEARTTTAPDVDFTPVEIYASDERLSLSADAPASFHLVLQIADGYHVLAADPWVDDPYSGMRGLIPLRVHTLHGSGVSVYAEYPPGEPLDSGPLEIGRPRVYRGRVEFEVAAELGAELAGKPLLAVTFQACSMTECLAPRTVELDIALDIAG